MSLSERLLALFLAVGVAFAAGWGTAIRWRAGVDARDHLAAVESARETERLQARATSRISDALTQERLRSDRAAADAADRLRDLAASVPTPPGCPSRGDDARPAAGILHDADRDDLVALAREADAVSARLRACQQLIQQPTKGEP